MKCVQCQAELGRCAQCLVTAAHFKKVFCVDDGKAHVCSQGCVNVHRVKISKSQTTLVVA